MEPHRALALQLGRGGITPRPQSFQRNAIPGKQQACRLSRWEGARPPLCKGGCSHGLSRAPQTHVHPNPQNVTFRGSRAFAGVTRCVR